MLFSAYFGGYLGFRCYLVHILVVVWGLGVINCICWLLFRCYLGYILGVIWWLFDILFVFWCYLRAI